MSPFYKELFYREFLYKEFHIQLQVDPECTYPTGSSALYATIR